MLPRLGCCVPLLLLDVMFDCVPLIVSILISGSSDHGVPAGPPPEYDVTTRGPPPKPVEAAAAQQQVR